MEEMKWFSSVMFGVSTANSLGFGLDLAGTCDTTSEKFLRRPLEFSLRGV
jgi:hypothetical protein